MKKIVIVSLALMTLTVASSAFAWTKQDQAFEMAYMATHITHWGQSLAISSQCRTNTNRETSDVKGICPSTQSLNGYFISAALLHAGITHILPRKYRTPFQASTIAMEVGYINSNAKVGLNIQF